MESTSTEHSYSDTFEVERTSDASFSISASGSGASQGATLETQNNGDSFDRSRSASRSTPENSRFDRTRSSVSDTLTYRSDDENKQQEGFTDVDDYSDTFEETGKTTTSCPYPSESYLETLRSSTHSHTFQDASNSSLETVENASKSYLETVETMSKSYLETVESMSKCYLETGESSGTTNLETKVSGSYLESVATFENTSDLEQKYMDESFESRSPTGTSIDLHTFDMTESHIFGPATEEIRELTEEDLMKAEAFEARENFINHWTSKLKYGRKLDPLDTVSHDRHIEKKKSESSAQKSFCRRKIDQLKKKDNQSASGMKGLQLTDGRHGKHSRGTSEKKNTPVEAYGLNLAIVDRLRLDNVLQKMEKLSSEEVHDVKTCKTCCKQQKFLEESEAKKQFLAYHTTRLRSKEVDIMVENHLVKQTGINMIGEILRDLPCLGECNSHEIIYQYKTRIQNRMKDSISSAYPQ